MFKLIWNLLALIGLAIVAGLITVMVQHGDGLSNLRDFDEKAPQVYMELAKTLLATGNAAEATIWKVPVDDGLSVQDVEDTLRFVANEHNIKNVGELPLSTQVEAMTGETQRFLKIYMFCNPLTAAQMVAYSDAFSAYLPCRVSLVEDSDGKLWLYTLNMDMMIHGGKTLPDDLKAEANSVKDTILDIINRGAHGEF
ncbi:MAG: DUF302 domain-containing protein [Gammaproteobacteria bacterium]|nr:DUF302 domain-containing protein [Gammaproteobacteria bacterium]MDH3559887.1 DUF302 domain-containing protein [Gammaproteobacteria bacterium]